MNTPEGDDGGCAERLEASLGFSRQVVQSATFRMRLNWTPYSDNICKMLGKVHVGYVEMPVRVN